MRRRIRLDNPVVSRIISAILVLGTGAVLAIALWLDPAPAGHGTHTQLGLGDCSFLTWTGYPCPVCGMTTTFTLMAHLRPIQAVITQPMGVVLFLMTVATFAVGLVELIVPRLRWHKLVRWAAPYEGRLAALFLVGLGAGWVYKIVMMGAWTGVP